MDDLITALQEDTTKLRGMAAGNRELEAVAQVLSRVTAALSDVERRLRALPPAPLDTALPVPVTTSSSTDCSAVC
jgi:hypothetical protein